MKEEGFKKHALSMVKAFIERSESSGRRVHVESCSVKDGGGLWRRKSSLLAV